MPKPKDPNKAPRLRWSPEEMDLLIREVALYLVAAERNGKPLTQNEALAMAQHVLPQERRREIGADYNPRWMSNEGRLEAAIKQAHAEPAPKAEAAPAPKKTSAPTAEPAPVEKKQAAKTAAKSAKARAPQAGLFSEQASGAMPEAAAPSAGAAAAAPKANLLPAADTSAAREAAPASAPSTAAPAPEPVIAPEPVLAKPSAAAEPQLQQEPAFANPGSPKPGRRPAPEMATAPAVAPPAPPRGPVPASPVAQAAPAAEADALAILGVNVLAGAFRSMVTKALAGLLTDVLRQPEVQAALRDAVGSAISSALPTAQTLQAAPRPAIASHPDQGKRRVMREVAEPIPALPTSLEPEAAEELPESMSEPELDDEAPPSDPYAWQPTPLEALPQRTARGASDLPKPTVLLFGLLPRDQHKLRADFADKYNLRFGAPNKIRNLSGDLRKVDKVYSLVRFIPKELDRDLVASGVPYAPLGSVGELRQDLTINPPLSRSEVV